MLSPLSRGVPDSFTRVADWLREKNAYFLSCVYCTVPQYLIQLSHRKSLAIFALHCTIGFMPKSKEKNPAAVALAKLGASKGGKARAAKLSAKRRQEIARKAIAARWKKVK